MASQLARPHPWSPYRNRDQVHIDAHQLIGPIFSVHHKGYVHATCLLSRVGRLYWPLCVFPDSLGSVRPTTIRGTRRPLTISGTHLGAASWPSWVVSICLRWIQ